MGIKKEKCLMICHQMREIKISKTRSIRSWHSDISATISHKTQLIKCLIKHSHNIKTLGAFIFHLPIQLRVSTSNQWIQAERIATAKTPAVLNSIANALPAENTAKTVIVMAVITTWRMKVLGKKPLQPYWKETQMPLDLKFQVYLHLNHLWLTLLGLYYFRTNQ